MFDEHYNSTKIIKIRYSAIYVLSIVISLLLFLLLKIIVLLAFAIVIVFRLISFNITMHRYLKYLLELDSQPISKISASDKNVIFHKINNIPTFSNEVICLKNSNITVDIRCNGKLYKNVPLQIDKEYNTISTFKKIPSFNGQKINIENKKRVVS